MTVRTFDVATRRVRTAWTLWASVRRAISYDDGATRETNGIMRFTLASAWNPTPRWR